MVITNFKIEDTIGLVYAGHYHDLHNDYNFEGFKYSVSSTVPVLEMKWIKFSRKDDEFALNKLSGFKLVFNAVSLLMVAGRDDEMEFSEDKCIDVIGFLTQEDRHDMNSFSEKQIFENDDMVMIFRGGQTFKINADKVELIPKE